MDYVILHYAILHNANENDEYEAVEQSVYHREICQSGVLL